MSATPQVFLGTVAIEPQRWAGFVPTPASDTPGELTRVSSWLDTIAAAGFDGIEIWERHITDAEPAEIGAISEHELPVTIFNSYASLDDPSPALRSAVAAWVDLLGCTGVKFNVGNDASAQHQYVDRIASWLDQLPASTALLCECHHGISIAEDPAVAAAIFDAAGPTDRLQAIVHTHEDPDHIRARFDAYGDRISHIHVNFLDFDDIGAPRLADIRDRVRVQAELLGELGFNGTWTIEFTHGVVTENDHPEFLVQQAADDLSVLREVLGKVRS